MRFFLHGVIDPATQAALMRRGHGCHTSLELAQQSDAPGEVAGDPGLLLPLLGKKQWHLLTTDVDFVHQVYERRIAFAGTIVLLLEHALTEAASPAALQAEAIERLFERYARLAPRRLYTVTPSRVKIRQLPGARRK